MKPAPLRSTQEQDWFNALSKVLDVGVAFLDSNLEIDFANRQANDLLGSASDNLEKSRVQWAAIVPQIDRQILPRAGIQPGRVTTDIELKVDDEPRPLRLDIYRLDDEDCEGYLALIRDRRSIEVLEQSFRLASQMKALTHLHRATAHDLRAALNTIVLNLELLRVSVESEAQDRRAALGRALSAIQEATRRVTQIFDVYAMRVSAHAATVERFDLREIVHDLEMLVLAQVKQQQVSLIIRVSPTEVRFEGHRHDLRQALLNLLINALEAMPEGGRIEIEMEAGENEVRIDIRDSGPGILPRLKDRMFRLYTTSKAEGSGIGLYVTKSIIESHGGKIQLKSEPGQGACFSVSLPRRPLTPAD